MKEYQTLIGAIFIAVAILISGTLLSNAIKNAGIFVGSCTSNISTSISSIGAQIEDAFNNPPASSQQ